MKKQLLTIRMLLVVAMLCLGVNVSWGDSEIVTYDLMGKFTTGSSTACTLTDGKIVTPEAIATELNKNATYTFTWSGTPRAKGDGSGVDVSTSNNGTFTISGLSGGEMIIVKSHALNDDRSFTVAKGQKCVVAGVDVETTTSAKTVASADGTYSPIYMKAGATSLTITSETDYTILESVSIVTPDTKYTRNVTYGDANIWTSDDATEWGGGTSIDIPSSTEDATAHYGLGGESNWTSSWAATKSLTLLDDSKVKYELVWYAGGAPGADSGYTSFNHSYIQFGNKIRIYWNQNYYFYLSTNATCDNSQSIGIKGSNTYYSCPITLIVNRATNKVERLLFRGTDYTSLVTDVEDENFHKITLGYDRNRKGNSVKNYVTSVNVTEYKQPECAYTINYTYGGETISSEEGTAIEGTTVEATKTSMWNAGNTQKYYVSGEATTSFTATGRAATNVFEVALREAEIWNYTVNCVDASSNILKAIAGSVVEGEQANVKYCQYINHNGTLYEASKLSDAGKQYRYDFTPSNDEDVKTITYNTTAISDVLFYTEGEDIDGSTITIINSGGNYSRTSNCATAVASNTELVTLPAGSYKATVYFYNTSQSGTYPVTISDGTNTLYTNSFGNGRGNNTSAEDFVLTETKTLYITGGYSSQNVQAGIDLVYITGTPYTEVELAIIDCKKYETSEDFATYIDAGTYASAAEVYAAHTAWQVENGTPSKAILDNTVTSADHWSGDAGTLSEGADYAGAPDTYYLSRENNSYNVNQIVYQLPAGVYRASAWTYSSAAKWRKIYVSKVPAQGSWTDLIYPETSDEGWVELSGEFTLTEPANIAFGLYADAQTGRTAGFDNWTLTKIESVSATIGSTGYTTFASSYPLDLSNLPVGITAYTASVVGESEVTFTPATTAVAAGTGLLLKGTADTSYDIPVVASGETISGNKMVGCPIATEITPSDSYYVLVNNNGTAEFRPLSGTYTNNKVTIPAGKAYLDVNAGTARALSIALDNEEVTGINNVQGSGVKVQGCYNLNGQRVAQPAKGLYIINGRKVVVK